MIRVNREGEVWVFAEQEDGVLNDVSLELCGKARQLGDQLGVQVAAVLPGCDVRPLSRRLIAHGVDRVYSVHDEKLRHYQTNAYAKVLVELAKKHEPQIVLFGATHLGRDLAPRVASAVRAGMTADCTDLQIKDVTDPRSKEVHREPAAADPSRVRRQHRGDDRQLRHVAADGDGPRGRDAAAGAGPEADGRDRSTKRCRWRRRTCR